LLSIPAKKVAVLPAKQQTSKMLKKELKIMSYYIYLLFNSDNELLYVGKTVHPHGRFTWHKNSQLWSNEVEKIKYAKCLSKTDMNIYETYYINKLKPRYNKALVVGEEPSFTLPELNFSEASTKISHKEKAIKTTLLLNEDLYRAFKSYQTDRLLETGESITFQDFIIEALKGKLRECLK
jgi:predicted GIY-YIG superfamily endonuclease